MALRRRLPEAGPLRRRPTAPPRPRPPRRTTIRRWRINANTPLVYPTALLRAGIEGTVLIRMYADEHGKLLADSTRVAESSGYPALDSAAVSGAAELRFSPALRARAARWPAPFLQPIQFRNPADAERAMTPPHRRPYDTVLDTIGWTPLIRLDRVDARHPHAGLRQGGVLQSRAAR